MNVYNPNLIEFNISDFHSEIPTNNSKYCYEIWIGHYPRKIYKGY